MGFFTTSKGVRGGTYIFGVGAFLLVGSFALIGVFWRWWYEPKINVPMRVLAIVCLATGVCMTVGGLVNNYLCALDSRYNKLWGDKSLRPSTVVFIIFCIVGEIGVVCTSIGFIHWFAKEVNLPLQGCGIAFMVVGVFVAIACFAVNVGVVKRSSHVKRGGKKGVRRSIDMT